MNMKTIKMRKRIKESRLPHKWAIDFRNMNTAVHGLFYGADRKEVKAFYNNLTDLESEEMDGYEIENLMNAFENIGIIPEIDYRRIKLLPSGKLGIVIDDVEYWIINDVSEDVYMESKQKGKWKKIMKESDDNESTPKVYVGTYAKYNDGSLGGEWIDLTDFDTYEDFVDYCRELHKDEKDPEFMVSDYEGFPSSWYHESGLPSEEEFYRIIELSNMDNSEKMAFSDFVEEFGGDVTLENFYDSYRGHYDSELDFTYELLDENGIPDDQIDMYFDYESFGRDITMDWHEGDPDNEDYDGKPEDPDYWYDNEGVRESEISMSDSEIGEYWIDGLYGDVSKMDKEMLERYFDYNAFSRDLFISDCWMSDNGYVFWRNW